MIGRRMEEIGLRLDRKSSEMMKNTYLQLIELVRRVLKGDEGQLNTELFPDVNDIEMWKNIFNLAVMQEVSVFLYEATKTIELPEKVRNNFYFVYNRAVRKEAIMHFEISNYFAALDREKITYLPIKGWNLKNLYAKPYLRTMTDVDVIVRRDGFERACEIAKECEFHFEAGGEAHHVFVKKPVTELEVHYQLFAERSIFYQWGQSILEKSNKYKMSDEDAYIYMFAHMAKHFTGEGAGMRNLIDSYLFNKNYSFSEEQSIYINKTLKELELDVFEKRIQQLTEIWFEGGAYDEVAITLTEYIMDGGLYGKAGNKGSMDLSMNPTSKIKWLAVQIFPDFEYLKKHLGYKNMYKPLTPIYWIIRIVKGLFHKGRVSTRVASMMKKEDDLIKTKQILDYVGINKTRY